MVVKTDGKMAVKSAYTWAYQMVGKRGGERVVKTVESKAGEMVAMMAEK